MRLVLIALIFVMASVGAHAQSIVSYRSMGPDGSEATFEAHLSLPAANTGRGPAVVLLHSGGGWEKPVTEQYAAALVAAGFTVLEPRLFRNGRSAPSNPPSLLPAVYGALAFLAERDNVDPARVGLSGFSFGGGLTLHAAAAWAQARYAKDGQRYAAHAPFYPICWAFGAFARGARSNPIVPAGAFTRWTGAPVHIFAGGRDDYDDKDPNACADFVSALPADMQKSFAVTVYPDATHGWDQNSAKFFEKIACKGRGCENSNVSNPAVTKQGIEEMVAFFREKLKLK